VDNRALSRALAEAFRRAGGRILNAEVMAVQAKTVTTAAGRHDADAVIVAAGPWSAALGLPVMPVKGQMIALAPPPGGDIPDPVIWGNGVYLVPRPLVGESGRLLVGATMEEAGFDLTLTAAARDDLRARAEAILPHLKTWTLVEHWAGLRPRSPDGLPLLGRMANGVFAAAGSVPQRHPLRARHRRPPARPGAGPRRRHSRVRSPKVCLGDSHDRLHRRSRHPVAHPSRRRLAARQRFRL
jgi:glycine oxidase